MDTTKIEKNKDPSINIRAGYYLKQRLLDDCLTKELPACKLPADIGSLKDRKVVFDWSATYYYDLATILWSLIIFGHLKNQGCKLKLILPDLEANNTNALRVWSFLKKWKFFDALFDCVEHPANLLPDYQIKWLGVPSKYSDAYIKDQDGNTQQVDKHGLLNITNFALKRADNLASAKNTKIEGYENLFRTNLVLSALKNLCGWEYGDAEKFVDKVVVECLDNASGHSTGNLVLAAFNIDEKNMVFSVADNGIGIPDTLRSAFKTNEKFRDLVRKKDSELIIYFTQRQMILDSDLIKLAVRKEVTTSPERAGLGLYYCKQKVLEKGGELRIRSGSACVEFSNKSVEKVTDRLAKSECSAIRVLIPLKNR